tara:strand:- start:93 stop:263 length:171 start_codon:yes stop_codon:yes gene_type:complete
LKDAQSLYNSNKYGLNGDARMIWHANKVQTYNNNRWAIDACITLATNTQQEIMMNF